MFLVLPLLLSMLIGTTCKNMVLWLLRLCVFYYCVQVLQKIGSTSYQTFRKYARVLTSELPKLSTKVIVLYVGHSDRLRLFKNRCTLLNQPTTFRMNHVCQQLILYCLFIKILFFMYRELVKELTLEVQSEQQKAVRSDNSRKSSLTDKIISSFFQAFYSRTYHHPRSVRGGPTKSDKGGKLT